MNVSATETCPQGVSAILVGDDDQDLVDMTALVLPTKIGKYHVTTFRGGIYRVSLSIRLPSDVPDRLLQATAVPPVMYEDLKALSPAGVFSKGLGQPPVAPDPWARRKKGDQLLDWARIATMLALTETRTPLVWANDKFDIGIRRDGDTLILIYQPAPPSGEHEPLAR